MLLVCTFSNFQFLQVKDAAVSSRQQGQRAFGKVAGGGMCPFCPLSTWKMGGGKLNGFMQLPLAPRPSGLVLWDCAQPALWKTSSPPGQGELADGAGKL